MQWDYCMGVVRVIASQRGIVPDVLRRARERRGLSQEELAEALSVTRVTISNWENGRTAPLSVFVPLLADRLGLSTEALYGRVSEEETERQLRESSIRRDYESYIEDYGADPLAGLGSRRRPSRRFWSDGRENVKPIDQSEAEPAFFAPVAYDEPPAPVLALSAA